MPYTATFQRGLVRYIQSLGAEIHHFIEILTLDRKIENSILNVSICLWDNSSELRGLTT